MIGWLKRVLRLAPPSGRALGAAGERVAARFLRRAGYRLVARNVAVRGGEVDLICVAPDRWTIVFVEVKTRLSHESTGRPTHAPEVNLDARKRAAMVRAARALARARRWTDRPLRIDVVAVEWSRAGEHVVRHHVGAF
ncbi:MAG: YraN family protein [Phycisphaerae bacterium]|nr:YraN family protein [Phycisphaerae bacterium]